MENQNQKNTSVIFPDDGGAQPQSSSSFASESANNPQALSLDPTTQNEEQAQAVASRGDAPRKEQNIFVRLAKRADVVLVILLILGSLGLVWSTRSGTPDRAGNISNEFATTEIPLAEFNTSGEGLDFGSQIVTINGALVVAPSSQPSNPRPGQIYYNQSNNVLSYFNGAQFLPLGGGVQSIGGLSGQIGVGGGLSVAGGQLTNTGILSVQGLTGDVSFTGGNGITVDGTTINNTGVVNVASGSSNIVVNTDANGNVTISSTAAGTGTVSSPGGTAGTIPVFTGAQTIANSLLSQSGGTITAGGNLAVSGNLTVSGTTNLSTPLSVSSGGTGATSLTVNGVLVGNGTSPITAVTGTPGDCLQLDGGGAPTFSACPGGGAGVDSLNGQTGAVNIANASGAGGTVTIDDASTAQKGIAQFNGSNFSAAAGVINTIQDINTGASPTFVDLTLTGDLAVNGGNITSTGALTVGTAAQALALQGSATTTFTATDGANTTTVGFVTPTADVNLNFPALSAGTYEICTSSGNCSGAGATLQTAYNNSSTPEITLDGTRGALTLQDAATPIGANLFEVQSNGGATTYFAVDASGAVVTGGVDISGTLTSGTANAFQVSAGGAVTAVGVDAGTGLIQGTGGLTAGGAITFSSLSNGFLEVDGAGVVSAGTINLGTDTVGDYIANLGALTGLSTTGNTGEGSTPTLSVNYGSTANTAVEGNTQITVTAGTNLTGGGALTLGAGGSVTVNVADSPTFAGDVTVQGGSIIAGADAQAGTLVLYDGGTGAAANTGTLQVVGALGQDTVYTLPDPGGATATICLDTGNCAGAGGGITGSGTTNTIPLFTGSQNIGDSIITQSGGTTINVGGTLTLDNDLGVAYGGTGASSFTANGVLYGSGTSALQATAAPTAGQVLLANGSGVPTFTSLTGDVTVNSSGVTAIGPDAVALGTDTTGNYVATITAGNGISGSSSTEGGSPTIALSDLTADWLQGGAFDIVLDNADSQLSILESAGGTFYGAIDVGDLSADHTYTFPDSTGTVCLDSGNCLGGGGGGANTALSNLTGVAINTTLLPGSAGAIDLGSGTLPFGDLFLSGTSGAPGTNNFRITGASTGGTRTISLPDQDGTVCLSSGNCIGGGGGGAPAGAQYLTLALDGNLTNERVLNPGNSLTVTDNGANGTYDIDTVQDIRTTATPTFGGLTLNGALTLSGNDINGTNFDVTGATGDIASAGSATLQGGGLTLGADSQAGTITLFDGGIGVAAHTGILQVAGALGQNTTYTLPDPGQATANICLSTGNCAGAGSGVTSGGGTPNTLAKFTSGQNIEDSNITDDGSTVAIGVNTNVTGNFDASGTLTAGTGDAFQVSSAGAVTAVGVNAGSGLLQGTGGLTVTGSTNINTTGTANTAIGNATGTFALTSAGLNVTTAGAVSGVTTLTASGNINTSGGALQTGGTSRIDNSGNLVNIVNGTLSGDLAVNGGDITSTGALNITPGGALTAGATGQILTLQGNASSTLTATDSGFTTTVGFATPTANATLNFPALPLGTYDICTSNGNCAGAGVTLQAAYNNSTSPEITVDGTRGALTIQDAAVPIGANLLEIRANGGGTTYFAVDVSGVNITGTTVSTGNINTTSGALQTGGTSRVDNTGNLVNIGNLTATGGLTITSTGAGNDIILDSADEIQIQGFTRVTSGLDVSSDLTVGVSNAFNVSQTGGNITTIGTADIQGGSVTVGADAQAGSLILYDGGTGVAAHTGTLQVISSLGQDTVYTLPDPASASATICLNTGNCAGQGGVIGGSGTTNRLAKFTGSGTIGDSSITDDGTAVTLNTDVDLLLQGATAYISNPQSQTASEAFGLNASVTGSNAVAAGNGATAQLDSVAIGQGSLGRGGGVAIGQGAISGSSGGAISIGDGASSSNSSVAIGGSANTSGTDAVAVGVAATAGFEGVALGDASTAASWGIAIGKGANAGQHQLVIGGPGNAPAADSFINQAFFGNGVTDATPVDVTLNATGGSGTDIAGAALNIAGGRGTGAAAGGNVNIQVSAAGASGTTLNPLSTVATFSPTSLTMGSNVDILMQGATAFISNPQATATSEAFGAGATVSSNNSLAVGNGASATSQATALGFNAQATSSTATAVGADAQAANGGTALGYSANGGGGVAIGSNTVSGGTNGIAIGVGAQANGGNSVVVGNITAGSANAVRVGNGGSVSTRSTAVGGDATAGFESTVLGYGASASTDDSIAIGYNATTTAASQLVIGSTDSPIQQAFVGNGVTNATPTGFTLNATGGNGTDIAGADLNIAGGRSTGTGAGGSVNIQVSAAGTTGTTLNPLSSVATFGASSVTIGSASLNTALTLQSGSSDISLLSSGNVSIGTVDATGTLLVLDTKNTAGDPTGVNGAMYYNSNSGNFRCFQGGSWVDCITASGGFVSLQNAYDNSTNPEIVLDATRGALTLRDAATPIGANLFEIQDNGGTATYLGVTTSAATLGTNVDLLMQGATAYISNPQGQTNSEAFGLNASVTGGDAVAVGNGATAVADSVIVGFGASSTGFGGPVAIGEGASATSWGVAVGQGSSTTGNNGVAVGNGATGAQDAVAIGVASTASSFGIAIGHEATTGGNSRIVIGNGATATADNQLVIGGNTATGVPINDAYIGSGVTDATPQDITLNATGGNGTDIAGADLSIAGGRGTGAASGGSVNIQVSSAGSSGTTLNPLSTVATFDATGLTVNGNINALSTTEQLRVSYDGSNYTSLTVSSDGNLTISANGTVGNSIYSTDLLKLGTVSDPGTAYNYMADSLATVSSSFSSGAGNNSLYIQGRLEVDGGLFPGVGAGEVLFGGLAGVIDGDGSNFTYDSSNHRLAIGRNNPQSSIHIETTDQDAAVELEAHGTASPFVVMHTGNNDMWLAGFDDTDNGDYKISFDNEVGDQIPEFGVNDYFSITQAGLVEISGELNVGSFSGAGLTDCDAQNSKLLWDATTEQFSCGTDRASVQVRKTADQTVSATTLQNDSELLFSVAANEVYIFELYLHVNVDDMNYAISGPTGATCDYTTSLLDTGGALLEHGSTACGVTQTVENSGTPLDTTLLLKGAIVNGANAGTVQFQFSEIDTTGSSVTVEAGSYWVAYRMDGADLGEVYYTHDSTLQPGHVVSIDPTLSAGVKKSEEPYDRESIGIVSTKPGFVLGDGELAAQSPGGSPITLALAGRVPVKVSTENGPIEPGDYLTASSTPGVAMKATQTGQTIGKALTGYSGSGEGTVTVFVDNSYVEPVNGIELPESIEQVSIEALRQAVLSGGLVEITGHIRVGDDTAGTVTIPAGQTSAIVTFGTPYEFVPKITTGTSDFVHVVVTDKTVDGFKVRIESSQSDDIHIDWTALEVE